MTEKDHLTWHTLALSFIMFFGPFRSFHILYAVMLTRTQVAGLILTRPRINITAYMHPFCVLWS